MERIPLRNEFEKKKNKKLIVQFKVPKVGHTQLAWIACVCTSIRVCVCVYMTVQLPYSIKTFPQLFYELYRINAQTLIQLMGKHHYLWLYDGKCP